MHEGERREDRVVARTTVGEIGGVHNTARLDQTVGAAGTNAAKEGLLSRCQVDRRGVSVADREKVLPGHVPRASSLPYALLLEVPESFGQLLSGAWIVGRAGLADQ